MYILILLSPFPDINECEMTVDNDCTQVCTNTNGSYICSCNQGFVLTNSTMCEGKKLFLAFMTAGFSL